MTARWRWDAAGLPLAAGALCLSCGLLISRGQWLVPAGLMALAGMVAAGFAAGRTLLVLLTMAALLEPPLGTIAIGPIGPIDDVTLGEVMVPALILGVFLSKLGGQRATRATDRDAVGVDRGARLVHLLVGVFAAVILLNIVRSEFFLETTSVLRPYYAYVVAFGIYYLTYHALTRSHHAISTLLGFTFVLSVVICAIGVTAVVLHLPFNLGNFRYSVYDSVSGSVRAGFLEPFGVAGLALVVVGLGWFRLPAGLLFAAAVVASGGRAAIFGVAVGILLYLVITRRGLPLIVIAVVSLSLLPVALPALQNSAQVQRLTNVSETAVYEDWRGELYDESFREFSHHPLIGTGFGVPWAGFLGKDQHEVQYYTLQFQYGGHGAYVSLLRNFGLAGFLPFVAALLVALWRLGRIARLSPPAGFFFIFLVSQAVSLFVGGNGSESAYFFSLGGAVAVLAGTARRKPAAGTPADVAPSRPRATPRELAPEPA